MGTNTCGRNPNRTAYTERVPPQHEETRLAGKKKDKKDKKDKKGK